MSVSRKSTDRKLTGFDVAMSFCEACASTLNGDVDYDAKVCSGKGSASALVYNLVGAEREVIIPDGVEPVTNVLLLQEMGFVEVDESELRGKEFPLPIETITQLIRLGAKAAGQPIKWFVSQEWLAPLESDGRFMNRFVDTIRFHKTKTRLDGIVYAVYGEFLICLRCIKRIHEKGFFCTPTASEEQINEVLNSH